MAEPLLPPARVRVEDRGYETPCWVWTGATTSAGYGHMRRGKTFVLAHVAGYEETHGPGPAGCEIDHKCEVKLCRRGSHLEATTHAENVRRGRSAKITAAIAAEIRRLRAGGARPRDLAVQFGIASCSVSNICAGRVWADV